MAMLGHAETVIDRAVAAGRIESRRGAQFLWIDIGDRLERLGPVVRAVAQDERSQLRNRELAVERILEQLRAATKVRRPRRPTAPTRAAQERRLDEKRRRGRTKRLRREIGD